MIHETMNQDAARAFLSWAPVLGGSSVWDAARMIAAVREVGLDEAMQIMNLAPSERGALAELCHMEDAPVFLPVAYLHKSKPMQLSLF